MAHHPPRIALALASLLLLPLLTRCGPGTSAEEGGAALVAMPGDAAVVADAGRPDAGPSDGGPTDGGPDAGDGGSCPTGTYPGLDGTCQKCPPENTTPYCSDGSNGHQASSCPPGYYCAIHDEVCNELGECLPTPDGGRGDGGPCDGGVIDQGGSCCMVGTSCGAGTGAHFGLVPGADGGVGYCACEQDDGGTGGGGSSDGGDAGQCTPGNCWVDPGTPPYNVCQLQDSSGACMELHCADPAVPCVDLSTSTGFSCCDPSDGGPDAGSGDVCGDGTCGITEDCNTCPQDCGACGGDSCDAGTGTGAGAAGTRASLTAPSCAPPPPPNDDCNLVPGDVLRADSPSTGIVAANIKSDHDNFVCKSAKVFLPSPPPNHTQMAVTGGNWVGATVSEAIEGGVRLSVLGKSIGVPVTGLVHVGASYGPYVGLEADCIATGHLNSVVDVYKPPEAFLVQRPQAAAAALAAVGTPYQLVVGNGVLWWEDIHYFPKFDYWRGWHWFPSKLYCSELVFFAYNGDYTTTACNGGLPGEPALAGCPNWAPNQAPALMRGVFLGVGAGWGYQTAAIPNDFVKKCVRRPGAPLLLPDGTPNPHYLQKVIPAD
jgi:hypothetical protein